MGANAFSGDLYFHGMTKACAHLALDMRRMQETEAQRLDEADKAAGRRPTGAPRGWIDPRSKRPAVPHGWRSVARDWAAEQGYDRDLAEIALAHVVGSDVERAYRRGDMLDRLLSDAIAILPHILGSLPHNSGRNRLDFLGTVWLCFQLETRVYWNDGAQSGMDDGGHPIRHTNLSSY